VTAMETARTAAAQGVGERVEVAAAVEEVRTGPDGRYTRRSRELAGATASLKVAARARRRAGARASLKVAVCLAENLVVRATARTVVTRAVAEVDSTRTP